jgi:cellobiose-specific phosphotransferase system component IIC
MAQLAPRSGGSPPAPDWTVQAADHIESIVEAVKEKTTVPVTTVARALVFGLIAAAMGLAALVFVVIGLLRLHVYLPFFKSNEGRKVWVTDAGAGAIFILLGALLWRKRQPKEKR